LAHQGHNVVHDSVVTNLIAANWLMRGVMSIFSTAIWKPGPLKQGCAAARSRPDDISPATLRTEKSLMVLAVFFILFIRGKSQI
jgi:hypothetical protein